MVMAAAGSASGCMGSARTVTAGHMEESLEENTANSVCRSLKYLLKVIAYQSVWPKVSITHTEERPKCQAVTRNGALLVEMSHSTSVASQLLPHSMENSMPDSRPPVWPARDGMCNDRKEERLANRPWEIGVEILWCKPHNLCVRFEGGGLATLESQSSLPPIQLPSQHVLIYNGGWWILETV